MALLHQLTPNLKHLRLSGILETLESRNREAVAGQWSYVEFLERLLQDEVERRSQKQLALRLRRGAINTTKTLESAPAILTVVPQTSAVKVFAPLSEEGQTSTSTVALRTYKVIGEK